MSRSRRDALCILVFCLACLILRAPGLDRIALNPYESQYEAAASYYMATSTSAFEDTPALTGTLIFYKLTTFLFGPYPVVPMRVLVLVANLLIAFMLYFMIRTGGSRAAGLAAGLIFIYYNTWYEGYTVNREWFAGMLIVSAAGLYVASGTSRRRWWLLAASGLGCGIALWFKLQAGYLTLAVPAALVLEAVSARRWRGLPASIAAYGFGGAASVAIYASGYALSGNLSESIGFFSFAMERYVDAGPGAASSGAWVLVQRFFLGQEFRPLLLMAYLGGGVTLISALGGLRRPVAPAAAERLVLIFSTLLVTGMGAVAMGGRFHRHYYLLIIPAVAGLCGMLADAVRVPGAVQATRKRWLYLIVILLLAERIWVLAQQSPARLWRAGADSAWVVAYVVALLALVGYCLGRARRPHAALLVALLWLEIATLAVHTHRRGVPDSLPYHSRAFPRLSREVQSRAAPDDRLFVWGWLPELYTVSRLEAASRFSIAQFVVRDLGSAAIEPGIDPRYGDRMMRDLRGRRPRFIVDAWRRSWTMQGSGDPWLYDLRLYPEFEFVAFLRNGYVKVGNFEGCELYVRDE